MHRLIVVLGPTASGKSTLGVKLAKRFHGIVISADSRQVYRGLNIGTGKITRPEMRGVPHYLLDVAAPGGQYTADRYVRDVKKVLQNTPPATPVFLIGGSPFYIDALTKPGSYSPVPPNPALRRRLDKLSTARLITMLRRLNPERLKNIDTANRRRLIRAIEIATNHTPLPEGGRAYLSGRQAGGVGAPRARRGAGVVALPVLHILKLGITIPKPRLHKNIDRRVDQRLRGGMVAEVRRLHRQGLSWRRLDAFGLEYRFLSRYLRSQATKKEAVVQLKSAIRDFAKRQMTWWKRDTEIHWVTPTQATPLVRRFLQSQ